MAETEFYVVNRVKWDRTGSSLRQELSHSGDRLLGLPCDLEDIELGEKVRAELFTENVLGWFSWEIDGR